jgi:hypothetical protein
METDIGNPIQYKPELDLEEEIDYDDGHHQREQQPQHYYHQPPVMMMPPPPPPPTTDTKLDFSNLDKNTYIVMFIAFIVGFFMGKTMQPVILRAM